MTAPTQRDPRVAEGVFPFPVCGRTTAEAIGQSCIDCGAPISIYSKGRCRTCAYSRQKVLLTVPEDFSELAPCMSNTALSRYYRRDDTVISRWRNESGIPVPPMPEPLNKMPLPDGFAVIAPTMTMSDLCSAYKCSKEVIRRWCKETGAAPCRAKVTRGRRPIVGMDAAGKAKATPMVAHRDMSRASLAANFLQRTDAIWRCTATGTQDPKGTHWRYLGAIRTDVEIVERAERKGFDPDAWKRLGNAA